MAWEVKTLLHKPQDVSSVPGTHVRSQMQWCTSALPAFHIHMRGRGRGTAQTLAGQLVSAEAWETCLLNGGRRSPLSYRRCGLQRPAHTQMMMVVKVVVKGG